MNIVRIVALSFFCISSTSHIFCQTKVQAAAKPVAEDSLIHTDRWLEIDLYWFDKNDIQSSVNQFWQRFHPLFKGVAGWRGVILNVGWLTDYVTDWRGNPDDTIPIVKGMTQEDWFSVRGHLTGTLANKYKQWTQRFAKPANAQRKAYVDWTYKDLKILTSTLRETAKEKYNFDNIKVGSFVLAWKYIYGSKASGWSLRHPEAFSSFAMQNESNSTLDATALLKADICHYGAFPNGTQAGLPVAEFFGKQWGDFSKTIGLDVIVLRDGMLGTGVYRRFGPFGKTLSADTAQNEKMIRALSDLVRVTKQSNPKALVIGYSSAASAVADFRTNAFDLEATAKEGYLDAFIDQTWAGAWNEVGIRYGGDNFWNMPYLGWTYQLAYMLIHGAVLTDTKTRHYQLTETFDAWESWDVIHTAPQRLRWGIWAYSHAAVKTPSGLKMPDGAYISWANQGTRLLSDSDVVFLADELDSAYNDAANIKDVFGPTLVYNRAALTWQNEHAPDKSIKEWIDEYAGSLMKWGLPILSATRIEYLDKIKTDLPILQTPVHLNNDQKNYIIKQMDGSKPFFIIGSPTGGIDRDIANEGGLLSNDENGIWKKYGIITQRNKYTSGLDTIFSLRQYYTANQTAGNVKILYSAADTLPANGSTELKLMVNDGNDGRSFDYVDWANARLITASGKNIYLNNINPYVEVQDYARLTNKTNIIGEPIKVNGESYDNGIGMHANAEAVYHLPPGKYQRFKSIVGIDDSEGKNGQVKAEIFINGKQVYESGLINQKNPFEKIEINIPDEIKKVNPQFSPALVVTDSSSGKRMLTLDPPEFTYEPSLPVVNNIGGNAAPLVLSVRVMQDFLKQTASPYIPNIDPQKPIWMGAWQLRDGSYRLLTADLEEAINFSSDKLISHIISLPQQWGNKFRLKELWHKQSSIISDSQVKINLNYTESDFYKISVE